MLYFLLFLVFSSILLFSLGLYRFFMAERLFLEKRLGLLRKPKDEKRCYEREELQQPLWKRLLQPFWKIREKIVCYLNRQMPAETRLGLQQKLQGAGNPGGGPGEFRFLQVILSLICGFLFFLLGLQGDLENLRLGLMVAIGLIAGCFLPQAYLRQRCNERRKDVTRSLPDVLDLLTVSVEAGLGFDIALVKVTERFHGVLSEEFCRLLQEMKMGKNRREALKSMANRIDVADFSAFASALIQADQLGVSLGNILRIQSEQMRRKRRQRAEEQAMQAPVKMLFPLVFFIFPALFIILLGPAMIQIMQAF